MGTLTMLVLALPPMAAAIALAVFAALESAGSRPFTMAPQNVAEAAGLANASEVLRLLRSGADVTRVMPSRPEFISSAIPLISALEAAVWSRHVELVHMLDDEGVISADERHRLACLAADLEIGDIVDYLSPGSPPDCVAGQVAQEIRDRAAGRR
jgi:hypothetical protein